MGHTAGGTPLKIQHFVRPAGLAEAAEALRSAEGQWAPLAGGTTLTRSRGHAVSGLVDLSLLGLGEIHHGRAGYFLGATATAAELVASETVRGIAGGMLAAAARATGPTPLRNRTTLGGNLVRGRPWSPLVTALLTLDASVRIAGLRERAAGISDFVAALPDRALAAGELVTGVVISNECAERAGAYTRFARTSFDAAILDLAVALDMQDGAIRFARVALGGSGTPPRRFPEVESALVGQDPASSKILAEAGGLLAAQAAPVGDFRASAAYLERIIPVLLERTIRDALGGEA